jgi:hypothetical protein
VAEETIEVSEPVASPTLTPVNLARYREWIRSAIAAFLLVILAGVIVASFLVVFKPKDSVDSALLEKLLAIIFGPLIALVSAATGFYFGSRSEGS